MPEAALLLCSAPPGAITGRIAYGMESATCASTAIRKPSAASPACYRR
jgi:hypothetical protein